MLIKLIFKHSGPNDYTMTAVLRYHNWGLENTGTPCCGIWIDAHFTAPRPGCHLEIHINSKLVCSQFTNTMCSGFIPTVRQLFPPNLRHPLTRPVTANAVKAICYRSCPLRLGLPQFLFQALWKIQGCKIRCLLYNIYIAYVETTVMYIAPFSTSLL